MDVINKRRSQAGPTSAQSIAQRQQTLATGKAGMGQTGPAMSNLQAQVAAQAGQAQQAAQGLGVQQQTSAMMQQQAQGDQAFAAAQQQQQRQFGVQQQAIQAQEQIQMQQREAQDQMASQQLRQQEQQARERMSNQYANQLAELTSQHGIVTNQILGGLGRARQELGADKFYAGLEQLGHIMAMSDRAYADEIVRVGQINNLKDEIAFKREATELAFGQSMEILKQTMDIQALINAEARETGRIVRQMKDDTAWELGMQAAKEESYKQMMQGMNSTAKASTKVDWESVLKEDTTNDTLTGSPHAGPVAGGTYGPTSSGPAYQDPTSRGGYYNTPNTRWEWE